MKKVTKNIVVLFVVLFVSGLGALNNLRNRTQTVSPATAATAKPVQRDSGVTLFSLEPFILRATPPTAREILEGFAVNGGEVSRPDPQDPNCYTLPMPETAEAMYAVNFDPDDQGQIRKATKLYFIPAHPEEKELYLEELEDISIAGWWPSVNVTMYVFPSQVVGLGAQVSVNNRLHPAATVFDVLRRDVRHDWIVSWVNGQIVAEPR